MSSSGEKLVTGDGLPTTISNIEKVYRSTVNYSLPASGSIQRMSANEYTLTANFSTLDCDNHEYVKTSKNYILSTKSNRIDSVKGLPVFHSPSELGSAVSDNGRYIARFRSSQTSASSTDVKKSLEIWDRSRLLKTVEVKELVMNMTFGSFVWSKKGKQDKLLFLSQKKRPNPMPFFKDPPKDVSDETASAPRPSQYDITYNWGEGLTDIDHTIVCILDVSAEFKITYIDVPGYSLASARWFDNDTKIVTLAYEEETPRPGLSYCTNKPCEILVLDLSSDPPTIVSRVASSEECYSELRVNNAGDKYIFLASTIYGPHMNARKLYINGLNDSPRELINKETRRNEYFISQLPSNCFTSDDKKILLTTIDHVYTCLCLYDIQSGRLCKIKFPTTSVNIFDYRHDILLASGSDINATTTLFVAVLDGKNENDVVAWHQIEDLVYLSDLDYQVYKIPIKDSVNKDSFISSIFVSPNLKHLRDNEQTKGLISNTNKLPTIILIHGGPHSAFLVSYMNNLAFYARLGFNLLLVNYRGSLGVNKEYVEILEGNSGKLDVEDCLSAVRFAVDKGLIDRNKLFIMGGSHGGFLGTHLSCSHEFKFLGAVIRNPVIEMSTMCAITDIPEWCFTVGPGESGQRAKENFFLPTPEVHQKMYECSPLRKVAKMNVPTLMQLGSEDKRVPMSQGLRWVNILRQKGVDVTCKVYPDKHDLQKAEVFLDACISTAIWLLQRLNK